MFTEAFEGFIEATPEAVLKQVVFEFRQSNIVENFDEFQVARGLIKSKGAQIAVDPDLSADRGGSSWISRLYRRGEHRQDPLAQRRGRRPQGTRAGDKIHDRLQRASRS